MCLNVFCCRVLAGVSRNVSLVAGYAPRVTPFEFWAPEKFIAVLSQDQIPLESLVEGAFFAFPAKRGLAPVLCIPDDLAAAIG